MGSDIFFVFQFGAVLFLFGAAAFPLSSWLFRRWYDKGYFFSKAVAMATVTFLMYAGGTLGVLPFKNWAILLSLGVVFMVGILLRKYASHSQNLSSDSESFPSSNTQGRWFLFVIEEIIFFSLLLFWSWIKGHEASIRSLEKFMDFGFAQVILNQQYVSFGQPTFPAPDIWFAGSHINYYYFGHTTLSILTKLSGIDLTITFNIMLAALFALCATMSGAIGVQLILSNFSLQIHKQPQNKQTSQAVLHDQMIAARQRYLRVALATTAGLVTAFLTSVAGNMQTIYAFTRGYTGEDVKPFWELFWSWSEFFPKLQEGLQTYWYANATRFIPFTIHEFPAYSFVVSDIHGHVLSIPYALLAIVLLLVIFGKEDSRNDNIETERVVGQRLFYGFLVAVLFMTNALDGPIYAGIYIFLVIFFEKSSSHGKMMDWVKIKSGSLLPLIVAPLAALPFLVYFNSFVTGLAINCPPSFLAQRKIGPFLFETVDKCQKSPFWMWWLLWGFFFFCVAWLLVRKIKKRQNEKYNIFIYKITKLSCEITHQEKLLFCIAMYCLFLLVFPEFFYFKDIYPAHFRSNTMFKLGYQAFMMLSIISAYTIVSSLRPKKFPTGMFVSKKYMVFFVLLLPQLFLVSIYPIFAVRSYFNSLREYTGLSGITWFSQQYADDYAGVLWLKQQLQDQTVTLKKVHQKETLPVIVEADGDSYTDYERYSVFTGLPTVVGWAVHEWLWRGSYDVVSPKREEVRLIYESADIGETKDILKKYGVTYIVVGQLEREKFKALNEAKIAQFALEVFRQGTTVIFRVL